jgi:hypothetical protein
MVRSPSVLGSVTSTLWSEGASLDDDLLHPNDVIAVVLIAAGVVGAGFIPVVVMGFAVMWLVMRATCGSRDM